MNKAEARSIIRQHKARLEDNLDKSTSQFQIKLCYVNAHEELLDIAQNIINNMAHEDDHK
jgi:predicted acyl esterase